MNEMDLKTKFEGLKKAIAEHNDFAGTYTNDLAKAEQELQDYNKPELTPEQFDLITGAIEVAIEDFDFSDTDNFEIDYSLDYDGRVQCESHEFINGSDLAEIICNAVYKLFKEADCPEDDQVNTHTVAEKII